MSTAPGTVPSLPPLVKAAIHHLVALAALYKDRLGLRVEIARSYRIVDGKPAVRLLLLCDPQSDTLRRDEAAALREAVEHLRHVGFFADGGLDGLGRPVIRLSGYYGIAGPEPRPLADVIDLAAERARRSA